MLTTYLGQPFDSPFYRASSVIDRISELQMPILHLEGWYDAFTRGQMMLIGRLLDLERTGVVAGPNYAILELTLLQQFLHELLDLVDSFARLFH